MSTIPKYELDNKKELLNRLRKKKMYSGKITMLLLDYEALFRIAKEFVYRKQIVLCGRGVSKMLAEMISIRLAGCTIGSVVMDTELNDNIHMGLPLIQNQTLTVVIPFRTIIL